MKELSITVKQLYDALEILEKRKFEIDKLEYLQKNKIQVLDENNEWIDVNAVIKKRKNLRKLKFDNNTDLICSNEHLICRDFSISKECETADSFKVGDIIKTVNENITVLSNDSLNKKEDVYDFQVNSDSHLFQTENGLIHHNSGKGKSLMCDQFLGNNIKLTKGISFKVEIEDAGGREFTAAIVGSQEIADKIKIIEPIPDEKGNFKPITIEKLTSFFNKLVQFQISKKSKTPVMVVIDSISQITSDKEFEDVQKDKDTRDMTVQQKMRAFFRVLTQQQRMANLTIIGIAHMTANIGVMFGPKTVINSKGSGFKYASSMDIEVKSNKEIKNKDVTVGYKMKLTTSKNRLTFKGRSVWIDFYTHGGIDRYSGLCEILARYEVFKPSAKPDVNGFYKDSVSFTWKDMKFKEKDFPKLLEEKGEEKTLKELLDLLNARFESLCKREGLTEEDLILDETDSEDVEDSLLEEQV